MQHRPIIYKDGGLAQMPYGDTLVTGEGLPSGYTAYVFGGVLYFGYAAYGGGGWAVLRNDAGALALADGATNGDATLPARASWPDLNYIGY